MANNIVIGYVHPGVMQEATARSLMEICLHRGNPIVGIISSSSPRQHVARNSTIERFLEGKGDWLLWVDTDMTFDRDAPSRLLHTALKNKADMVAGLCFVYKRHASEIGTNAYMWNGETHVEVDGYKPGTVIEVDATGSAFILIHRRVFEAMAAEQDEDWYHWHQNYVKHPETGEPMGHDLAFAREAGKLGFKLLYDTNVGTGHIKYFELTEQNYFDYKGIS